MQISIYRLCIIHVIKNIRSRFFNREYLRAVVKATGRIQTGSVFQIIIDSGLDPDHHVIALRIGMFVTDISKQQKHIRKCVNIR